MFAVHVFLIIVLSFFCFIFVAVNMSYQSDIDKLQRELDNAMIDCIIQERELLPPPEHK